MKDNKVLINEIIENQLPNFVREEFPLVGEFLSQYYLSLESKGNPYDLIQNLDDYVKVDNLTNLKESTKLTSQVDEFDTIINVESIDSFPSRYGLLQIDDEIITYTESVDNKITGVCNVGVGTTIVYINELNEELYLGKTINIEPFDKQPKIISISSNFIVISEILIENESVEGYNNNNTYNFSVSSPQFKDCKRGFSGITSYDNSTSKDQLVFSATSTASHANSSVVTNLNILFLKKFFKKIKSQFTPGFENQEFYENLNENLFIKQSNDFYKSKGTDSSFKILFGALYGKPVDIIKPRDFLIQPSDAQYNIFKDLVVESVEGNPENLLNITLIQDGDGFFNPARGTVNRVEKISRNGNPYYIISLDYSYNRDINVRGTVQSEFNIHPKTTLINTCISGSSFLDVDSTVGFPNSGELIVELDNGGSLIIEYKSKNINQFLECSNINIDINQGTVLKLNTYAYGIYNDEPIQVRINGVIENLLINEHENNFLFQKNDNVEIKTLGHDSKSILANNWFFNIPVEYDVKNIEQTNPTNYLIELYDNHSFVVGDTFLIDNIRGTVVSIQNETSIIIRPDSILNTNQAYTIKKNVSKVNCINYPELNIHNANIQNVYYDLEDSYYVASHSLPYYLNEEITVKDNIIILDGIVAIVDNNIEVQDEDRIVNSVLTLNENHSYYTGDCIVFKSSELNTSNLIDGIYYVEKISTNTIKLARSRENLFKKNYISIEGSIYGSISLFDFNDSTFNIKKLKSQKLIRKISTPTESVDTNNDLNFGPIGILINGVEILNYKSKDKVFYGPIESIVPTSYGNSYDVINPPVLSINDQIGSGAVAYCDVIGQLERIDIIDPGFDYLETPVINITGGNGKDASAVANLVQFTYSASINSENANLLNFSDGTIGFSTYHRFKNYEKVIYDTQENPSIIGLNTNSTYYVRNVGMSSIRLHKSHEDAVLGINTITFTSIGKGIHLFKSTEKKKKIGSITVENKGHNYSNRKRTVLPVGINTSSDIIVIKNHGFNNEEIIEYNSTETSISGLTSATSYYVTKITEDEFKLSGISTDVEKNYFYKTKQFINLKSSGTGYHIFNYPPIKVELNGKVGSEYENQQNFNAIISPIFRGKIDNVFIESGGTSYGSESILNYDRQPTFELNSGKDAEIIPVISFNGRIVDVVIQSKGVGYNSPPDIVVNGDGAGCILTPVINNGEIVDIKIISTGGGYTQQNTRIQVIPAGQGAKFEANIKSWSVNLVEKAKNSNQIEDDDGFLYPNPNEEYGLEYFHLYASNKLRSSVYCRENNGNLIADILNDSSSDLYHSPLLGWSYDGVPIYGTYAYTLSTGNSQIKALKSSYSIKSDADLIEQNRPTGYPKGFFVEDYEFTNNGDLDEYNGRFCITPEFPNGTYAYFCTLNDEKEPSFPYVIGSKYKYKPIEFNFDFNSNQDDINLNNTNWVRNTTPHNLLSNTSRYNYIFNLKENNIKTSVISSISEGELSEVEVVIPGDNYKVRDSVVINSGNNKETLGYISSVKGKEVNQIGIAITYIENIEFLLNSDLSYTGFSTAPHNLKNNDIINVTSKYEFNKSTTIDVSNNILYLSSDVDSVDNTGITTYFNVSGILNSKNIRENDVYKVSNEFVKILSVDNISSRIRVLRNINNYVGVTSYISGTILTENPRKFNFNIGITSSYYNNKVNKEIYFNPKEAVSVGTLGISSTLYFESPGVGSTYVQVPLKSIYLPNHNLDTNTQLIYSNNGGTSISVSTDTISTFILSNNSIVYVSKINEDLIGLSTSNITTDSNETNLLYFTGIGTNTYHSFKTNYDSIFSGEIQNNLVTVTTDLNHNLELNDEVDLTVTSGLTTTVYIQYNDYNRRLVINPKNIEQVSVSEDILKITNHNYSTGDKVIYSTGSPIGGLENQGIYYIVVINKDKIKLSNTLFGSKKILPDTIELTSSGTGSLSSINPNLSVIKGQTVIFDLSHISLSFNRNSLKSAFEFNLFSDSNYKNKLEFINGVGPEIFKQGRIGIDSFSRLTLKITDNVPQKIYYNLTPINYKENLPVKLEIITDEEQLNNNQINIVESRFSGKHKITGITSTTFSYNLSQKIPEINSYTSANSLIEYFTTSESTSGPINKINILNKSKKYLKLPSLDTINSSDGQNSFIQINTSNIGKINKIKVKDIGYNYPSDFTIRPKAKIPQILKINSLSTFERIEVTSFGNDYNIAPDLVVLDGITNEVVNDVKLRYVLGENKVQIIENTKGISSVKPKIIPINNSNGVGINSITYIEESKDVIITIKGSNYSELPFNVNDEVFIEYVDVFEGKGYNSENYNYSYFRLTDVQNNSGVISVTYSLDGFIGNDENPGEYDDTFITGKIIKVTDLIQLNPIIKVLPFLKGELVFSNNAEGSVSSWDDKNLYLNALSSFIFKEGDIIRGKTSNSYGTIEKVYSNDLSFYTISSSSIVNKGWEKETGFLNNDLQRMPDNDYYQYFSYSLKSEIDYNKWDNIVDTLNHTAGFKKFSNLIVNGNNLDKESVTGIPTTFDSTSDLFVEVDSYVDLNCVTDFDFAAEGSVLFPDGYKSSQIYMKNILLKDYFEIIGSRVLILDDISNSFDNTNTSFNLTVNDLSVFKREFIGTAVSITENIIRIPEHYFVTGEEIKYVPPTDGSPIEIQSTFIAGIGITDILPTTLYIIKESDLDIKVAASATEALLSVPSPLQITSIGTGTTHTFISNEQNSRVLLTIDKVVQSPIVSTSITCTTSSSVGVDTTVIPVVGLTTIYSGNFIQIEDEIMKVTSIQNDSIEVIRGFVGTGITTHNINSLVRKVKGNYNIIDNILYFAGVPNGKLPVETLMPDELDFSGLSTSSSFSGRVFLRSGIPNTEFTPYDTNYIFDDISDQFDGTERNFNLTKNNQNLVGFSTGNAIIALNSIIQSPNGFNVEGDFSLEEEVGITTVTFAGTGSSVSYDVNTSNIPRGGIILSVGSSEGFGYQPLIGAGGTAIVSIAGTIESISIGNSGSGYRSGLQTVNVGIQTDNGFTIIGIASIVSGHVTDVIITNPGSGYTFTSPPDLVFDVPLSYSNIPLIYSSSSTGIGTGAKVDIIVGRETKVISFELTNLGYGYENGDILTIDIGGATGIPTTSGQFEEFNIQVDRIYNDDFTGWYPGDIRVFDPLDRYFNGSRKSFAIRLNNVPQTITSKIGSNIDPQNSILLFINEVLQEPNVNYTFNGSFIILDEAPEFGTKSKVFLYEGTSSVDIIINDIVETIKEGDVVRLADTNLQFNQDPRQVSEIKSPTIIETETYSGPGISTDSSYYRPLTWCRQVNDKIINKQIISKNRKIYEPSIYPTTSVISNVGINTTEIFVESLKTFFDNESEGPTYDVIIQNIDSSIPAEVEVIKNVTYEGDFGIITGVATSTYDNSDALIFDLYIPENSYLRNPEITDPVINECDLKTNYYFVVSNSNIGGITTSKAIDGSIIGISSFIDNVYQVASVSIGQTNVPGKLIPVDVAKVIVKCEYSDLTGIGYSNYYGNYSWGRITDFDRKDPKSFTAYTLNGYSGLSTSPIMYRYLPLKYQDYTLPNVLS